VRALAFSCIKVLVLELFCDQEVFADMRGKSIEIEGICSAVASEVAFR
jgi:hypothetical protein